jgi:radical SAM protein with 4Fe4S-binding SPASM domain
LEEPIEQIVFEVTYRCNINCNFCYNSWKATDYPKEPELTPEQYEVLLSRLPKAKMYAISGGEPLVRKDFLQVTEVLYDRLPYMTLITNGINIDDGIASRLSRWNVRVQLPVQGLGAKHDAITGMPGNFKHLVDVFATLKDHNVPVATATVVSKDSIDDLEKVLEFSIAMGSKAILLIRFLPGGAGQDRWDLVPSKDDIARAYGILDRVCGHYGIRGAVGVPNLPCVVDEADYSNVIFNYCGAGRDWFVVDPSGRFRICNHSPVVYGNLMERTVDEIMEHPLLQAFARSEVYPPECGKCDELEGCRGGCRAVAETMYGDAYGPDPMMRIDVA